MPFKKSRLLCRLFFCFCAAAWNVSCQSGPEPEKPPRQIHWGAPAALAKNPAQIESRGVLAILGLPLRSGAHTAAGVKTVALFDESVAKIAAQKGFDAVLERNSVPGSKRLPDVTYHVARHMLMRQGDADPDRIALIDQVIVREEEMWDLLRQANVRDDKARAAQEQTQQFTAQKEKLEQTVQAEQAKVQQAEAMLASSTRNLQAKIDALSAQVAERQKRVQELEAALLVAEMMSLQKDLALLASPAPADRITALAARIDRVQQQIQGLPADAKEKLVPTVEALKKQLSGLSK